MAGSVNKCILIGNTTRDPEIKSFQSGDRIANFSLATNETWRDKTSGERKEKAEFHNIVVRGEGLVKVVENYVKKGSKLYVEGSLQTRKWQDKDGADRYTTEVVVSGFGGGITMLDGPHSNTSNNSNSSGDSYEAAGFAQGNDLEDSIPF